MDRRKLARSRLEALVAMGSGAIAEPVAGWAGLAGLLTGRGAQNVESVRDALTYQPRDPRGLQEIQRAIAPIAEPVERAKRYLGDRTMDATGSPAAAAAAYAAPETLAALLGMRGGGMRGPTMQQMAERSAGPRMGSPNAQVGAIGAWHGSPHDFDRFSMDAIGTGEGAQGYGHGLYFAGDPNVARTYQSKVSAMQGKAAPTIDGRPIDWNNPRESAAFELHRHGGDREAAAAFHESTFRGSEVPALLRSGEELPDVTPPGRLYNVELAPDETDLLDWDAPLTPELVQKVQHVAPGYMSGGMPNGISQSDAYHFLAERLGEAGASNFLREQGIPGIRYLDQGSRGADSGTRNYVMFDDSLVKIRGKE